MRSEKAVGKKQYMWEKHLQDKVLEQRNLEVVEIQWEVVFISQCSNVRIEGGKGSSEVNDVRLIV